uniref:Delta-aminolevulinic acid dehydratase n=1 Tax=Hematodinium sp. SG-2015 TaxID=1649283 RepID=A0A0F7C9F8_9DINO|nr:HemB [Hematodinium sp. SG-2015]|eukprot:GEMP01028881.1.p1 GENE.GEMP01028881.1~~GEMP01028881.1.p1  ORF type:complete len:330 (+),score=72.40 GEMP01028881.1:100-1089(+)
MSRLHPSLHHPAAREWLEAHIHSSMLVYPLFVTDRDEDKDIAGFSPNKQWGRGPNGDYVTLVAHLKELEEKGLRSVMLFGVIGEAKKDEVGSDGYDARTPVCLCLQGLARACPNLQLMADVCLCEYTSHGHCGALREVTGEQVINNQRTLEILAECAIAYAKAGAHMVCPSDMMDGRIEAIRSALDRHEFAHVSIMAYTSKKASCMYAPFRAAVESTFQGDRKRYQQPVGSAGIANRALRRDLAQGADVVLVKPSLWYGDIIRSFAQNSDVPVAAYVVSGEYKMLQDYAESTGDLGTVLKESHTSLVRAGATVLVTYFTPVLLDLIPTW